MSCTTKDLKYMEEYMSSELEANKFNIIANNILAMIARLKASEALHPLITHSFQCAKFLRGVNCDCGVDQAFETYRQSIGQDKGE